MIDNLKKLNFAILSCTFFLFTILFIFQTDVLYASENDQSILIKKVSKSYTQKFCNAIGFGLSKESAMKFSINETKQTFKKRKEFNNLKKELLAEEIAISVIEKCGYPISLSGEEGIIEFKDYYLSKDKAS